MTRFVLAVLAVAACGLAARAADPPKPLEASELDKRAAKVAFDAEVKGVKIYNDGDQSGCLRLYEGTLLALVSVLDHRPDLVKEIRSRLLEADTVSGVKEKAFALRSALDAVIEQTGPKKALWARLGGDKAVAKVVSEFVDKAAADKDLDYFGGKPPTDPATLNNLKASLLTLVSGAAGGPLPELAKEGKAALAAVKLTAKQFDRLASILGDVLNANKVPKAEREELLGIVNGVRKEVVAEKK